MRLSTKGRYAVMAMADLAKNGRGEGGESRAVSLAEIAARQEISLSYLEQLFARLRKGGLVRSVHPPDQLLDAARELAREIADNAAPVSVALARQMMWRMLGAPHPMNAHRVDSRAMRARCCAR